MDKIVVLLSIFSLTACALMEPDWVRPEGNTVKEYEMAAIDCHYQWSLLTPDSDTPYIIEEESQSMLGFMMVNAYVDPDFEAECLQSKGWKRRQ